MRKHFLLAVSMLALALAFSSCGEDLNYKLEVDNQTLIFAAEGSQAQVVKVTAENVEWTVEAGGAAAEWLHFEKKDGAVTVTVDNNTETTARTAKFIVKSNTAEAYSREVTVIQMGAEAQSIDIGVTVFVDMEFGYNGGTKPVTVTATEGLEWDVVVLEGADWVTFKKNAGGFTLTAASTMIAEPRVAKVAVRANGIEDVIVTVKQEGRIHIIQNVVTVRSAYWGFDTRTNQYVYTMNIWNEFVEDIGGGWIAYGPGAILFNIQFFSDAPASEGFPEIPAGTYTSVWENPGKFDAFVDVQIEDVDGVKGGYGLPNGTKFTLERNGDNYKIAFDKVLLGEEILFSVKYDGYIDVINGNYPTNLTGNVNFGEVSGPGSRIFSGDRAQNGTYMWGNVACSDGVTMTPDFFVGGTGFLFDFSLFTDQTDDKHIADGTYTISESLEAGTAYGVNYVELEDGSMVGETVLYKGKVIVSHEEDVYRIEFDAEDIKGNKVKGVWKGDYGFKAQSASTQSIGASNYTWKAPYTGTNKVKQINENVPRFKR